MGRYFRESKKASLLVRSHECQVVAAPSNSHKCVWSLQTEEEGATAQNIKNDSMDLYSFMEEETQACSDELDTYLKMPFTSASDNKITKFLHNHQK